MPVPSVWRRRSRTLRRRPSVLDRRRSATPCPLNRTPSRRSSGSPGTRTCPALAPDGRTRSPAGVEETLQHRSSTALYTYFTLCDSNIRRCEFKLIIEDGLRRPAVDVDALLAQRPAVTLTFDLQNLIRSSVWAIEYSMYVSLRLLKPFIWEIRGNLICSDERTNERTNARKDSAFAYIVGWRRNKYV